MERFQNKIQLPTYAEYALSSLQDAGFEGWIVGGFVRDSINKNTNLKHNIDIDITTNADPDTISSLFRGSEFAVYELGKKFGTIGLAYKGNPKQVIEITTYRQETGYADNRHPDKISFAKTIDQDLCRRDFTCNAIAYNPNIGFFDPYNGIKDIQDNIIRCVGDPYSRFEEDYLRILRAIRFSSQLGFKIENKTNQAVIDMAEHIINVSWERINTEMTKLLCGCEVKRILLDYAQLIFKVIPELKALYNFDQKTKYHSYDAYTHTAVVVDKMPKNVQGSKINSNESNKLIEAGVWAALLHDIGKPECFTIDDAGQGHFYNHPSASKEISRHALKRLKFSKSMQDAILLLIEHHDRPMAATKKSVKRAMRIFSQTKTEFELEDLFRIYCDLRRADSYAHAENFRENLTLTNNIEAIFEEILSEEEAFSLKDLDLDGHDIIELGVTPGPKISKILNTCLDMVIDGQLQNQKTTLINHVKTHLL